MAFLKSQIGRQDFFWIGNEKTGEWRLNRTAYRKDGKPRANLSMEEKICLGVKELDAATLAHFAQVENDLAFDLAAGTAPSQRPK